MMIGKLKQTSKITSATQPGVIHTFMVMCYPFFVTFHPVFSSSPVPQLDPPTLFLIVTLQSMFTLPQLILTLFFDVLTFFLNFLSFFLCFKLHLRNSQTLMLVGSPTHVCLVRLTREQIPVIFLLLGGIHPVQGLPPISDWCAPNFCMHTKGRACKDF